MLTNLTSRKTQPSAEDRFADLSTQLAKIVGRPVSMPAVETLFQSSEPNARSIADTFRALRPPVQLKGSQADQLIRRLASFKADEMRAGNVSTFVEVPATLLGCGHATEADARWVSDRMRHTAATYPDRPVHYRYECGFLIGAPGSVDEVVEARMFGRLKSGPIDEGGWREAILARDPKALASLESMYSALLPSHRRSIDAYAQSPDPYNSTLIREIRALGETRPVRILLEETPFAGYLSHLSSRIKLREYLHSLAAGDADRALLSFAQGKRCEASRDEARNEAIATAMSNDALRHPKAIQLLSMGIAHLDGISEHLARLGFAHRSYYGRGIGQFEGGRIVLAAIDEKLQKTDRYDALAPAIAKELFLEMVLMALHSYRRLPAVPRLRAQEALETVSPDFAQRWLSSVCSAPQGMDSLARRTIEFIEGSDIPELPHYLQHAR